MNDELYAYLRHADSCDKSQKGVASRCTCGLYKLLYTPTEYRVLPNKLPETTADIDKLAARVSELERRAAKTHDAKYDELRRTLIALRDGWHIWAEKLGSHRADTIGACARDLDLVIWPTCCPEGERE